MKLSDITIPAAQVVASPAPQKKKQSPRSYQHLFFDLDHTLWDLETNTRQVLDQLYEEYRLADLQLFTAEELYRKYRWVNRRLWTLFSEGKLTMPELRTIRFEQAFRKLGVKGSSIPAGFADAFTQLCPRQAAVLPFTRELLQHLSGRYQLHIITNGFPEIQHVKLKSAGISHFFTEVVTAGCSGFAKPDRRIFQYALHKTAAAAEHSLMIGDNLQADVRGARLAGIDQVYYNPAGYPHREKITYEVKCLSELIQLL